VIAATPGNLGGIARIALLTGMRQNEIVTLEWSQIDLKRTAINLTKTKIDRPRSVPLGPELDRH
jgi:integrase